MTFSLALFTDLSKVVENPSEFIYAKERRGFKMQDFGPDREFFTFLIPVEMVSKRIYFVDYRVYEVSIIVFLIAFLSSIHKRSYRLT